MPVEQYQRTVNSLDKEIAGLEKKKAEVEKRSSEIQIRINNIERSITKNTSSSMIKTKSNQIASLKKEYASKSKESAEYGKKIAEKRKKRNDSYLKLQKASQDEQKKLDREQKKIQEAYEKRIEDLSEKSIPHLFELENHSLRKNSNEEMYDVFVSHAWEDKESLVDELVLEMKNIGISVWYDTEKIAWGDSMRGKIDEGLRKSKFGIAILSPNYIAEGKYWTKAELDGLFQLESINGKKLLPIWHELTKKEVMEYSPIIASKLAMNTAMLTPREIAEEMKNIISA
ncbi:toll/interleukin-1 receptor domain-containing protein [Anaerosphaera multitolerans]|uniref:Toll/interleukin-1 receptor domain-containing protein n=1 Tax=Anaerosphaera multitolerans TaxID=2487351 RepID=A0A437SAQ8_9FIRM|nr:toll/interleukin-1 receptor domain-containing protein [Anaerosphaera multitolerans]RVU55858.1 toll/interleukin-1 receptor domain-containing protein [Anaerosphaera multitolerans]